MSTISRPIKSSSGTTEYIPNTLIDATEVDADFDLIYGDYDGNIDSTNIRAGSITYDRLLLTTPNANSIIALASPGLAVHGAITAACTTGLNFNVATTLVSVGPLTTLGGTVLVSGLCGLQWVLPPFVGPSTATIGFAWQRDGLPIGGGVRVQYELDPQPMSPSIGTGILPIPTPPLVDIGTGNGGTCAPGAHTWTLIAELPIVTLNPGSLVTSSANAGFYTAVELR
jgi:hypothetical protein